jgi:hypothetical protein
VFVTVFAAVTLGELPNINSHLLVKLYGLNHFFRGGLVGVILRINLIGILLSACVVSVNLHF